MVCSTKYSTKKTVEKPAKKVVRKTTAKKAAPKRKLTEFGNFLAHTSITRYMLISRNKPFTLSDIKSGIEVVSGVLNENGRMTKENWRIGKKTVKSKYWKLPGNYDAYDEEEAYRTDAEVVARMNRDLTNAKKAYKKDPKNPKNSRKEIYVINWR